MSYRLRLQFAGASLLMLLAFPLQSAQAQYFNYSPYSGASNVLWLARSLAYPLNRFSGYQAPFYLANSLVWNATYGAARGVGNRQYNNPSQVIDPGTGAPVVQSGSRRPSIRQPNLVTDQSVQANWSPSRIPPQDQQINPYATAPWVPVANAPGASAPDVIPEDPFAAPMNSVPSPAPAVAAQPAFAPQGYAPSAVASNAPYLNAASNGVGGDFAQPSQGKLSKRSSKKQKKNSVPNSGDIGSAQTSWQTTGESPLAKGFIHLVNDNYGGDIARSLQDPDMRKYAVSVGLIPSEQAASSISPQRAEILRQIFADHSQDAAVRINAARLLLKPTAP